MKPFGLKNKAGWKERESEEKKRQKDKKKNRKAVARKHYPPHLVINLLK